MISLTVILRSFHSIVGVDSGCSPWLSLILVEPIVELIIVIRSDCADAFVHKRGNRVGALVVVVVVGVPKVLLVERMAGICWPPVLFYKMIIQRAKKARNLVACPEFLNFFMSPNYGSKFVFCPQNSAKIYRNFFCQFSRIASKDQFSVAKIVWIHWELSPSYLLLCRFYGPRNHFFVWSHCRQVRPSPVDPNRTARFDLFRLLFQSSYVCPIGRPMILNSRRLGWICGKQCQKVVGHFATSIWQISLISKQRHKKY